ncbi:hypothetical protein B0H14DRAFT_2971038 [Mycena olivaceomarginata]|nr:hypothetical protein B0H14DRAFT_2971038 [Mycena olivaceomarginata]
MRKLVRRHIWVSNRMIVAWAPTTLSLLPSSSLAIVLFYRRHSLPPSRTINGVAARCGVITCAKPFSEGLC